MTETKAALLHKISQDARQAVQNWPKWKKEESDREDEHFREMGDVARNQK